MARALSEIVWEYSPPYEGVPRFSCDIPVFRVKFNVEFKSQVVNFP